MNNPETHRQHCYRGKPKGKPRLNNPETHATLLQKTEEATKNDQSRDTDNIEEKTQNEDKKKNKIETKKMSNTVTTKNQWVNTSVCEGYVFTLVSYKIPIIYSYSHPVISGRFQI
jgi:hypothetical protein